MGTFTSQIPRDLATKYGYEAVSIGEKGHYIAPSGRRVDLQAAIDHAVGASKSYPPDCSLEESVTGSHDTSIEITNETTLSAAVCQLQQGHRSAVLNFASATNPGGGFLNGARAQEEYLARSSCLYQCIRDNSMYAFHRSNSDPLYTDYVLYSPDVPVIRADDGALMENPYTLSIITAAAAQANRVPAVRHDMILPAMWARILKVLVVGVKHGHDAIVLGAWGCGAFGNDGNEIASLFRRALAENFRGAYRHVVFAIVDWSPERRFIGPFETAFRNMAQDGAANGAARRS